MCASPCRWVHAVCESLYTEDEVEQASDEGFACTSCTPYVPKPVGESKNDKADELESKIMVFKIFFDAQMSWFAFAFFSFPLLFCSRVSYYGFNKDQGARSVDFIYTQVHLS